MKSGFVSLIGRPNVGKSTLLNSILNTKVAITSSKPQTTRNIIQGIYNDKETQIVFVDTPGIHKPRGRLGKVLNKQALSLTKDVDLILFLVDVASGIGAGDEYILNMLKKEKIPVILVMNKIDKLKKEQLLGAINEAKDLFSFAEIVPVSALKKDNTDYLITIIKKYLVDDVVYFTPDMYTSNTQKFMVSEIVREKLLMVTEDEIPHSLTCYTASFEEKKDLVKILVDIVVDRDSLKKIIIGHNGSRLKTVGTLARRDIEELLGKKVYLELYVKAIKNWQEKEKYLKELGFIENYDK